MRDDVDSLMQTLRAMKAAEARRRREPPGSLAYEQAERDVERYAERVFGLDRGSNGGAEDDDDQDEAEEREQLTG
jgi:hypothetical protein